MFYESPLVWVGDYADQEEDSAENLYAMTTDMVDKAYSGVLATMYCVNHTKKLYVDKERIKALGLILRFTLCPCLRPRAMGVVAGTIMELERTLLGPGHEM
jgi:hypothetical protein